MSEPFLNRRRELDMLRALHRRRGAQFIALYGRRRIGKTSLVVHWLEEHKARAVYWVAHRSTSPVLLASFSRALAPLLGSADEGFTFSSWEAALTGVAQLAERTPLVVVIDELPYLLESVPSFATILQAAWDHKLKKTEVRLVVAGSHHHMMQDTLASPKGPLFGRTTADLSVDEVGLDEMGLFLPGYSREQLVETYSVVGGVPKYLEMWNDRHPVLRNIRDVVLSPASMFRNEPAFLIHDEIADPRTYLAILEGLGGGARRPVEIAGAAGVQLAHIGKYLHTLEALRFVRRIVSVDVKGSGKGRKTRYEVRDPYLRFYFAFVQPHLRLLEQQRFDRILEIIRAGFDAYVGKAGYEEICRRHVAELADQEELPFPLLDVGRLWDRNVEIDVAGIDHKSRNVLFGECRWRGKRAGVELLDGLKERGGRLTGLRGFKAHYAIFSRGGFTKELEERGRREGVLLVEGVPEPPSKREPR